MTATNATSAGVKWPIAGSRGGKGQQGVQRQQLAECRDSHGPCSKSQTAESMRRYIFQYQPTSMVVSTWAANSMATARSRISAAMSKAESNPHPKGPCNARIITFSDLPRDYALTSVTAAQWNSSRKPRQAQQRCHRLKRRSQSMAITGFHQAPLHRITPAKPS